MDHVFAYGSLAADPDARPARLSGFRRVWGVAMDNSVDLPGYKFYVDPETGERPPLCVAFLDLVADSDAAVDGALVPVTPERLPALDERERNYERRAVDLDGQARAWTYTGRAGSRARFEQALRADRLVVQRAYLELCGVPEPPPCPVRDLVRVELQ